VTTIGYPAWYKGGYPDVEVLVETLFTPMLSGVTPVHWWPAENVIESTLAAGGGYLSIYRTGGRINHEQNRDEPNVQFVALTKSRDESWKLVEFIRQVLGKFEQSTAVVPSTIHKLGCEGEILGPSLTRAEMRDERIVPATFSLLTWKPKGLGNYDEVFGL
jgi:hypothetical protein